MSVNYLDVFFTVGFFAFWTIIIVLIVKFFKNKKLKLKNS